MQGSKKQPDQVNLEIDSTISMFKAKLELFDETKLSEYKNSIIYELKKQDTNLKERSDYIWKEIFVDSLVFNRKDLLLEEINKISLEDVKDMFYDVFYKQPHKISIQVNNQ